MIIRSQDKKKIIPLNQPIYIETVSDKWKVSTERYFLGEYSTEEKAIKVLDMICNFYIRMVDVTNNIVQAKKEDSYVFQMPQDSEV